MAGTPYRDWMESAFDPTLYVRASHELHDSPERRQSFLDDHRSMTSDQLDWLAEQGEGQKSPGILRDEIISRVMDYNRDLCARAELNDFTTESLIGEVQKAIDEFLRKT